MLTTDLTKLQLDDIEYVPVEQLSLPITSGWMHSGCAITSDGTIAVAHPQGRRLILISPDGKSRTVSTPALEMHTILLDLYDGDDRLWLVNNGHRFVFHEPDYAHYREAGSIAQIKLDGTGVDRLEAPNIDAYQDEGWQPTSMCRTAGGVLWVADGYGANLIHEYSPDGQYRRTVNAVETGVALNCPHGLAARGDQVLIADRSNRRILVMENGEVSSILDAPLTSPSSILVLGRWLLVTELHGGLAVFRDDIYVGHYARSRDDHTRDAWPNSRDQHGNMTRPPLGGELHSPHGIAGNGERIIITEWLIGGRLNQLRAIYP
ncbi:hypothetical protein GCM10027414_11420 [Humibacter ginsengiterrae]